MVASKSKHKAISCSTPEHRPESPSRDSDSLSEAASPVPFLCTQDGAEGETDVVWNFYTPKSDHPPTSRIKNSTPLSTKARKPTKLKLIEKPLPKRRTVRPSQKNTELFQDLIELNQNLHELIAKKSNQLIEKPQSGSEEDIFNDSGESSPKSGLKTNTRCLRRNVLSSKFSKTEPETALESDDSMNECLIKASQVVEENILNIEPIPAKRKCYETSRNIQIYKPGINFNMDNDSMDAILNNINLDSPVVSKTKKYDSPKLNNDSFDTLVGNLNDSALDRLTQVPAKSNSNRNKLNSSTNNWTIKELVVHDGSPLNKSSFGRHNSMPESPLVPENKPSTSGMVFGRYNSMPHNNNGDSPIRCTPEEIKRKHQQAREKLLAKRQLPFTSSQQPSQQTLTSQAFKPAAQLPPQIAKPLPQTVQKKTQFQPKVPSTANVREPVVPNRTNIVPQSMPNNDPTNIKLLIEKKRQEALMKLRRRQPQTKP
ncbi:hypothetical protein NE865_14774 [Phthorimaea operculella]|nr:hypothetical protein NE865_14774 [Phthorimaea operculella]